MRNLWDYRECVWDYRESTWTLDSDLLGYDVHALDSLIGKILRVANEPVAYLVVDTSEVFDKRRLIPAGVVASLDHDHRRVHVALSKEQVSNAPDHDIDLWNDEIRMLHADYYGNVNP